MTGGIANNTLTQQTSVLQKAQPVNNVDSEFSSINEQPYSMLNSGNNLKHSLHNRIEQIKITRNGINIKYTHGLPPVEQMPEKSVVTNTNTRGVGRNYNVQSSYNFNTQQLSEFVNLFKRMQTQQHTTKTNTAALQNNVVSDNTLNNGSRVKSGLGWSHIQNFICFSFSLLCEATCKFGFLNSSAAVLSSLFVYFAYSTSLIFASGVIKVGLLIAALNIGYAVYNSTKKSVPLKQTLVTLYRVNKCVVMSIYFVIKTFFNVAYTICEVIVK